MATDRRRIVVAALGVLALLFGCVAFVFRGSGGALNMFATSALTSGALAVLFRLSKSPAKGKFAIRVNTLPQLAIATVVMLVGLGVVYFIVDRIAGFTVAAIEIGLLGGFIVAAVIVGYLRITSRSAPPA